MTLEKAHSEREEEWRKQHGERVKKFLKTADARTLGRLDAWATCFFCDGVIGLRKLMPRNIRYDKSKHICSKCRKERVDEIVKSGGSSG